MNTFSARFDTLNKDNYDTWKIQMRAVLIKNNAWGYVDGTEVKPEAVSGDEASANAVKAWKMADLKAQSDIILAMNPSEIKQVKSCQTSKEIWIKLEEIYQSKGAARKATLLNQLISMKMHEGDDAREHTHQFFDVVDKLSEMEIVIHPDLLVVILLRSLPEGFENFRCAISARDSLPTPEILRIKIAEEFDTRKDNGRNAPQNAMVASKFSKDKSHGYNRHEKSENEKSKKDSRMKCYNCGLIGHRSKNCRRSKKRNGDSRCANNVSLYASSRILQDEAFQVNGSADGNVWCIDSGCTSHMCKNIEAFAELNQKGHGILNLASNARTEIQGKGIVSTIANINGNSKVINLHDTLYVPDLRENLISVSKITDRGYKVIFEKSKAKVLDSNGKLLLTAQREKDLYNFRGTSKAECRNVVGEDGAKHTPKKNSLEDWHIRMGHLNVYSLREAVKSGSLVGVKIEDINENFECRTCLQGKMCRPTFPKVSERITNIGDLVHSDVVGPMRVTSLGNNRYFCTFVDDCSGWCEVKFIKQKNQVINEFDGFRAMMETQQGKHVKYLQSDNGLEYVNGDFNNLLQKHGIKRRLTAPYNPEQNGIAERRNRTLMDMTRCLMIQSNLPAYLWAEAVNTANYIRNRCPTKRLNGKSPYEVWFGEAPDVTNFKRFGCEVFIMDRSPGKSKLDPRSRKGIFVGYSSEAKAYRIWVPSEKKVETSRDVKFLEGSYISQDDRYEKFEPLNEESRKRSAVSRDSDEDHSNEEPSITIPFVETEDQGNEISEDIHGLAPIVPEVVEPETVYRNRPGRPRKIYTGFPGRPRLDRSRRLPDVPEEREEGHEAAIAFLADVPISEALSSTQRKEWMDALASEVKSIFKNDTWKLIDRSDAKDVIGSRFVLRDKRGTGGILEKRKARIVAKGYSQRYGRDFLETFAPVARLESIRLAVAVAAQNRMSIRQYDIATAYLNGKLEEDVFMEVPDEMVEILKYIIDNRTQDGEFVQQAKKMLNDLSTGDKVCHMNKALYGLKQAGRAWNQRLNQELRSLGATPTEADPCVYTSDRSGELMIIVVYVDDILIMCKDITEIIRFGNHLGDAFEVKDLGNLKRCLGIDFKMNNEKISMNQGTYIRDILNRFGMSDCNPVSTPADAGTRLSKGEVWSKTDGDKPQYRELIGCLLYLAVATRPDIAHVVSSLSQYNDCFGRLHWLAAKRVLRYLKGTMDLEISYQFGQGKIVGYVDADYGGSIDDRRSFTGYVFIMNGGAVSWDSRKQRTVAMSTTESEYMALSDAAKEVVHLSRFLIELGVTGVEKMTLFNDNCGAQKLATNPVYHARTKHIDVRHHFVREVVESGVLSLKHVSSKDMPADILTKFLSKPKHQHCIQLLGMS